MRLPVLSVLILWPALPAVGGDEEVFFERVEPLLRERCYACHSHANRELSGGLTLDSRSGWAEGGDNGPAVVPGDLEASLLIRKIRATDPEQRMPPDEPLSDDDRAVLESWVQSGALDPRTVRPAVVVDDWWSLRPLQAPEVPGDGHPIDAFLNATRRTRNLDASPGADRRTLIRRLTFDLHGLTPAPEDVAAFLADEDPEAWSRLVDQLLASPRYGERWARHWLDTVHFADSHGFEHDVIRPNGWPYRDYVIDSFNADTSWADRIRQQLAADVFFPAQPQWTTALGFLGAGNYDISAAATAPMSFEYLDRDDLVTQTMASFASTTANCARCHSHKFDPIMQEDYFALQAVFAGINRGEISYDRDPDVRDRRQQLAALLAAVEQQDASVLLSDTHAVKIAAWAAARVQDDVWQVLTPETFVSVDAQNLERLPDGSLRGGGPRPDKETTVVTLPLPAPSDHPWTALRLELLTDDALPMRGPGRNDNGNLHLTEIELQIFPTDGSSPRRLAIARASSDFDQTGFGVAQAADGNLATSWAIHPQVGQPHVGVFELAEPLTAAVGDRIVATLRQWQGGGHLLGRFRLSVSDRAVESISAMTAEVETALHLPDGQRSDKHRLAIAAAALREVALRDQKSLPSESVVWAAGRVAKNERGVLTLAEPRPIHVLHRGELDKPRQRVGPGALSGVTELTARFALPDPSNESARRAALAEWLADPRNPLTWRSVVNRVWHFHFGRGLCDTPNDFGRMGGTPSHPELLDWLAVWFRDDAKGSIKALNRLIVTSAAYQQASTWRSDAAALDPDNRWLWRMNAQRMDADSCRDSVLAISGRLDLTMGGPGVPNFTTTPGPQITPVVHYRGFDWSAPGAARRSIYRVVVRGVADPFMEALDFPDLGLVTPVRGFSASPLQALTMFNNDFMLFHSQQLADRIAAESQDSATQMERAFQLVLLRDPEPEEAEALTKLAATAGLAAACRVLLNSNEFLFID
jgi:hypothetical protein